MADKISVQLHVSANYTISETLKTLSTEDTELLLDYGENLLKGHYNSINIKVGNDQTSQLLKAIQDKDAELHNLKSINSTNKIKYKENTNKIQRQMASDIETESIKNQALLDFERNKYNNLCIKIESDKENTRNELNEKFLNEIDSIKKECDQYKILLKKLRLNQDAEYNNYRKLIEEERNKCYVLNEKMRNINDENFCKLEKYRNELQNEIKITRDRDEEIFKSQIERDQLNTRFVMNQMESNYNSNISILNARVEQAENTLRDKETCLNDVSKIVKYYEVSDTATKGANGEHKIQEIIKSYYSDSIITDTSGTAHSGDLFLTLVNLKCLVEVKNKKHITEMDITKFLGDIETQTSSKINCALFISLMSSNIPTKGSFYIEIKNSIPIIYMYMYDCSSVQFAIETLLFLTNKFVNLTKKSRNEQQLSDEIISLIYNNFNTMKYETDRITGIITHLEKQINQLKISKKNLVGRVDNIKTFYNKYENLEPQNEKEKDLKKELDSQQTKTAETQEPKQEYTSDDITLIKSWISDKKRLPNKPEIMTILKLSRYEINKRGTVDIRKKLKTHLESFTSKTFDLELKKCIVNT
jgi:hypothetical protein